MVSSGWFNLFRPPRIFATVVAIFGLFFSFLAIFYGSPDTAFIYGAEKTTRKVREYYEKTTRKLREFS